MHFEKYWQRKPCFFDWPVRTWQKNICLCEKYMILVKQRDCHFMKKSDSLDK